MARSAARSAKTGHSLGEAKAKAGRAPLSLVGPLSARDQPKLLGEIAATVLFVPDPGMRLCAACGGSGVNYDTRLGRDLVSDDELCLACGGDGQWPIAMPARDALADAETLRRFAFERGPEERNSHMRTGWNGLRVPVLRFHRPLAHPNATKVRAAARIAGRAREGLNEYQVQAAARAAFRAVPGLRGDA